MKGFKPTMFFSIIIPVYNAEKYLDEAVQSLIKQTLSFKEKVEVILIDDGSTDKSKEICLQYVNQYPANFKFVQSANLGPASARNLGVEYVSERTDFIGFLDSDDLFSNNTLEQVENFFNKNNDVSLAVIPLYYIDQREGDHRLNYRFEKGTRKVNILEEHQAIHFHIGGSFFNSSLLKNGKLKFQEDLHFWEDALMINRLLLHEKRYGLVSEATYFYRIRENNDSLVNKAWYKKERYSDFLRKCYKPIIDESLKRYGKVIPYVQYLISYHMRLYLYEKNNVIIYEVLNPYERSTFFDELISILKLIDKEIIYEQTMPLYFKEYLHSLKENGLPYKGVNTEPLEDIDRVIITDWKIKGLRLEIKGRFTNRFYNMKQDDQLFIKRKDKIYYMESDKVSKKEIKVWGTVIRDFSHTGFKTTIPLTFTSFQFGLEFSSKQKLLNNFSLMKTVLKKLQRN